MFNNIKKHQYYYALEKLKFIVKILATEPGDARDRVLLCYEEVVLLANGAAPIPESLGNRLLMVIRRITEKGSPKKTLGNCRKTTASDIAKELYSIYADLLSEIGDDEKLKT